MSIKGLATEKGKAFRQEAADNAARWHTHTRLTIGIYCPVSPAHDLKSQGCRDRHSGRYQPDSHHHREETFPTVCSELQVSEGRPALGDQEDMEVNPW